MCPQKAKSKVLRVPGKSDLCSQKAEILLSRVQGEYFSNIIIVSSFSGIPATTIPRTRTDFHQ